MTASPRTGPPLRQGASRGTKRGVWIGFILLVLVGIVLGTKAVPNDDPVVQGEIKFDAETFGADKFPEVQEQIIDQAVDAEELTGVIDADADEAADTYAEESSGGPIFSVSASGEIGEGASGIYELAVDDLPEDLLIRVQTGPAINGTELRDATGMMPFGEFENQIAYQNAAAALNDEMKIEVLADLDTDDLEGRKITVTGAFTLVNPDAWLITPVEFEVQ